MYSIVKQNQINTFLNLGTKTIIEKKFSYAEFEGDRDVSTL